MTLSQNPITKEEEKNEKKFFDITGESSTSILSYARTITDPWTYLEEVIKEVKEEFGYPDNCWQYETNFIENFIEAAELFLEGVDVSLMSKRALQENEDRWHTGYDPNAETRFLKYNPREFVRDVWGLDSVMFYTESRQTQTSRAEWKRVTEGESTQLRLLTEYGNFDFGLTAKAGRAKLRVRTQVRKGTPYLSIGAVQINMLTGKVACGVVGCKHVGQLSNKPDRNDPTEQKPDREWQEYQILRIIAHLGTHDLKSATKAFPVFLDAVKEFRDTDWMKDLSHWYWCSSNKCACRSNESNA